MLHDSTLSRHRSTKWAPQSEPPRTQNARLVESDSMSVVCRCTLNLTCHHHPAIVGRLSMLHLRYSTRTGVALGNNWQNHGVAPSFARGPDHWTLMVICTVRNTVRGAKIPSKFTSKICRPPTPTLPHTIPTVAANLPTHSAQTRPAAFQSTSRMILSPSWLPYPPDKHHAPNRLDFVHRGPGPHIWL